MVEVTDYRTLYHEQDRLIQLGGKTLQNFLRNYALFTCKIHINLQFNKKSQRIMGNMSRKKYD